MIIASSGEKVGKRGFSHFSRDSTRKRPVVVRPLPSKSFLLRQHRHRISLDQRLYISQHLGTGLYLL